MPDLFKNLSHSDYLLISGGFAGFCGSVSYLLCVTESKPFSWRDFFLQIISAAIFGLIGFEIFNYEGLPPQLSGALCGVAGLLGSHITRILQILFPNVFEILLLKRLGISKKELEENERE